MTFWKKPALILALSLIFYSACSQPEAARTENPGVEQASHTIADIEKNREALEGRRVTLSVVFRGWTGGCSSGPPVTRSDWMVEDQSGCLYVCGPVPEGLQPSQPKGELLSLTGTVRISRQGRAYLELDRE